MLLLYHISLAFSRFLCKKMTADKPQMRRKYLSSPLRGRGTAASAVVDELAKKLNKHLVFLITPLFPPHQSDFV